MTVSLRKVRHGSIRTAGQLVPMTGESQAAFFVRAMRALRQSIPSVNRRTVEVLSVWKNSANDQVLQEKGRTRFPTDAFRHYAPRCVFLEHSIPASRDGAQNEMTYGREALQQMVDWANYRILNSDTFSVLSDGHTPTQAELSTGRQMPDVLGYAGPFYLGQLGDLSPRWAIYADEWVHRESVSLYEKRQRRSPEVWISEPIERRTMDPIAALGAETPRLDCGMNSYCRAGDGQAVMPYSAMSIGMEISQPVPSDSSASDLPGQRLDFPGPTMFPVPDVHSSTHLPSGVFTMPLTSTGSTLHPAVDSRVDTGMLRHAVSQTVNALLPSIVRSVQQQLDGQADGNAGENAAFDLESPFEPDNSDGDELSFQDDDASPTELPGAEPHQPYSAMSQECQRAFRSGWKRGAELTHRYSHNADLHKVVARQQLRLQELSDQIARERRDAARYSKLNDLSREFAFDPREESETCCDMTDKQFDRHCTTTIVKYARRDDVTNVELFTDPTVSVDRFGSGTQSRASIEQFERYSRDAAAIAARKNAAKRGSTTFEAEFDAICKQHGVVV